MQSVIDHTTGLGASIYFGVMGLAGGTPYHSAYNMPARVILVAFAIFACIVLAAYTASSAAFLVNSGAKKYSINNLQEAFDFANANPGEKVCIRSAIKPNFEERYPHLNPDLLYTKNLASELIDALDEGDCVAAIISADSWDAQLRTNRLQRCGKTVVENSLFSEANGMPVREEYAHAISYLMAELKATGRYNQLVEDFKEELLPNVAPCEEKTQFEGEDVEALDSYDLLAPLLLCWGLTTAGLASYYTLGYSENFSFIQKLVREHASADLVDELNLYPISKLRKRALDSGIDPKAINDAIDLGRKKGRNELQDLILIAEEKVGLDRLHDRSVSELCEMCAELPEDFYERCTDFEGSKDDHIDRCLDHKGQKEAFIDLLTDILDADGDGQVSLAEMQEAAQAADADGSLTVENPLGDEEDAAAEEEEDS